MKKRSVPIKARLFLSDEKVGQMNLHNAEFVKSAAASSAFIKDDLPKIVFAGKSNVGKSSVINKVLNRKNFARVGSQPGKTVHVNYFMIDRRAYFTDLPGYGYAKVSKSERDRWGKLMESFFSDPESISLGIMIVDARHKPTADDVTMAQWFMQSGCPFVIVANKTDKVKKSELECNLELIRETLKINDETRIIPFSAETGSNRDELISVINDAAERHEQ